MFASITMTIDLPVYPERVFRAWLDSYEHSQFTDQPALVDPKNNIQFQTLGGRVRGEYLSVSPFDRIVQTWEMAEFPQNAPDSKIEFRLEPTCTGSELRINQTGVEMTQTRRMMEWWDDNYFRPMRVYFDNLAGDIPADEGDG